MGTLLVLAFIGKATSVPHWFIKCTSCAILATWVGYLVVQSYRVDRSYDADNQAEAEAIVKRSEGDWGADSHMKKA